MRPIRIFPPEIVLIQESFSSICYNLVSNWEAQNCLNYIILELLLFRETETRAVKMFLLVCIEMNKKKNLKSNIDSSLEKMRRRRRKNPISSRSATFSYRFSRINYITDFFFIFAQSKKRNVLHISPNYYAFQNLFLISARFSMTKKKKKGK